MNNYKLPLTVDDQQRISDAVNSFDVPVLLDLVVRCQDVLMGVREEIMGAKHYRMGTDASKHLRNALLMINRLID